MYDKIIKVLAEMRNIFTHYGATHCLSNLRALEFTANDYTNVPALNVVDIETNRLYDSICEEILDTNDEDTVNDCDHLSMLINQIYLLFSAWTEELPPLN